ncbi:MAG: hypothetical protein CME62_03865 [Halobacteriovoraceae bacterium]|nr:hypothetical protein [Halobacteriovoraceae bacterium]
MIKKLLLKNQTGASMIQMLIISGIVLSAGVGVMRTSDTHIKQAQGFVGNVQAVSFNRDLQQHLSDADICKQTLSGGSPTTPLENNREIAGGVVNKDGESIYEIAVDSSESNYPATHGGQNYEGTTVSQASMDAQKIYNGGVQLRGLKLVDFESKAGYNTQRAFLEVRTQSFVPDEEAAARSYTGYAKNNLVPVLIVTLDDQLVTCMSDEGGVAEQAFIDICFDLGGIYDADRMACDDVDEALTQRVINGMCSPTNIDNCVHPYAGKNCNSIAGNTDLFGLNYDNWVINGFNFGGNLSCECIPRTCPNPNTVCYNQPIGSDYCEVDCGLGTKMNLACCGPYGPAPSTQCDGVAFTQTDGCGRTQPAVGTSTTGACCVPTSPDPATICSGVTATGDDGCGGTYSVDGTKTTDECAACTPVIPDPATICDGVVDTGDDGCGNPYSVTGTKTTDECISCVANQGDSCDISLNRFVNLPGVWVGNASDPQCRVNRPAACPFPSSPTGTPQDRRPGLQGNPFVHGSYCTTGHGTQGMTCIYEDQGTIQCDGSCELNGTTGVCGSTLNSCVTSAGAQAIDSTSWTCPGVDGGIDTFCFISPAGTAGNCGPTLNTCDTAPDAIPIDSASWTCPGEFGGSDTFCSTPENGQCGATVNTCTSTEAAVEGDAYNWTCPGRFGGGNAICTLPEDGQCDTTYNQCLSSQPATGGNGSNQWTCPGSNGGDPASCSIAQDQPLCSNGSPAFDSKASCEASTGNSCFKLADYAYTPELTLCLSNPHVIGENSYPCSAKWCENLNPCAGGGCEWQQDEGIMEDACDSGSLPNLTTSDFGSNGCNGVEGTQCSNLNQQGLCQWNKNCSCGGGTYYCHWGSFTCKQK